MPFKLLYYSKLERRGFLLIASAIAVALVLLLHPATAYTEEEPTETAFEEQYTSFALSLSHEEQPLLDRESRYKQQEKIVPLLRPFDPNKADSTELVSLGLPTWMASSVLRYRNMGGRFKTPEAFSKVYGLTEEHFKTLLPFIEIAELPKDSSGLVAIGGADSIAHQFKYPIGTVLELNFADTTELKKIPGIGSSIAHLIVSYRAQLGGFYSIDQLKDINIKSDSLRQWLHVGDGETQRINLNTASLELLNSHPYFSFYQAKIIVEHRKSHRTIRHINELSVYDEFNEGELKKLRNYVLVGE